MYRVIPRFEEAEGADTTTQDARVLAGIGEPGREASVGETSTGLFLENLMKTANPEAHTEANTKAHTEAHTQTASGKPAAKEADEQSLRSQAVSSSFVDAASIRPKRRAHCRGPAASTPPPFSQPALNPSLFYNPGGHPPATFLPPHVLQELLLSRQMNAARFGFPGPGFVGYAPPPPFYFGGLPPPSGMYGSSVAPHQGCWPQALLNQEYYLNQAGAGGALGCVPGAPTPCYYPSNFYPSPFNQQLYVLANNSGDYFDQSLNALANGEGGSPSSSSSTALSPSPYPYPPHIVSYPQPPVAPPTMSQLPHFSTCQLPNSASISQLPRSASMMQLPNSASMMQFPLSLQTPPAASMPLTKTPLRSESFPGHFPSAQNTSLSFVPGRMPVMQWAPPADLTWRAVTEDQSRDENCLDLLLTVREMWLRWPKVCRTLSRQIELPPAALSKLRKATLGTNADITIEEEVLLELKPHRRTFDMRKLTNTFHKLVRHQLLPEVHFHMRFCHNLAKKSWTNLVRALQPPTGLRWLASLVSRPDPHPAVDITHTFVFLAKRRPDILVVRCDGIATIFNCASGEYCVNFEISLSAFAINGSLMNVCENETR